MDLDTENERLLEKVIVKFRLWNIEWDLYSSRGTSKKPISLNEFIKQLSDKFEIKEK